MKRFLATLFLLTNAALATAGTLADMSVIDRTTGERLQVWRHHGRNYVVGQPGKRYAIELANKSGGRILTVLSVDGVNAVTGQTAATGQSGYVLEPGQSHEILGWRKSMDDVAAFYFTRLANSYAARTGRPDNTGVIAVAVYREQLEPPPVAVESWENSVGRSTAAPSARADERAKETEKDMMSPKSAAEKRIGTGHGERIASSTQYTDFQRTSSTPAEIVTIYYDSRPNLVARGVIPTTYGRRPPLPQPFPGNFVPDPS